MASEIHSQLVHNLRVFWDNFFDINWVHEWMNNCTHFCCIHSSQDPVDENVWATLMVQSPCYDDAQTHCLWNGKCVNGTSWRGGGKRWCWLWRRRGGGGHPLRRTPAPTVGTILLGSNWKCLKNYTSVQLQQQLLQLVPSIFLKVLAVSSLAW